MSLQAVMLIGPKSDSMDDMLAVMETEPLIASYHLPMLEEAMAQLPEVLPDLILLYADGLDMDAKEVADFCRKVQETAAELDALLSGRPVLMIQTDQAGEKERIEYLVRGADEVLSADMSAEEQKIRLLVHLRRNIEVFSSRLTRLPDLPLAARLIQRCIAKERQNPEDAWALILIDIKHIDVYQEVYGELAAIQVLRSFGAMLHSLVFSPSMVGHLSEFNTFFVLTHADKAEKIAGVLARKFEDAVPNFYAERDKKRGYLISVMAGNISRRVPFFSLSMGIFNSRDAAPSYKSAPSYKLAINIAAEMKLLARSCPGSMWVSHRPKLAGEGAGEDDHLTEIRGRVLVVESDAAMAFLLKTTLEMQHYGVETVSSPAEAQVIMAEKTFNLVLMDALLNGEESGWDLCSTLKTNYPNLPVVFLSSVHNRDKALKVGGDLFLPKPFEMVALFTWIERLMPFK
ncbi:MAG: response regulator [Vampirovibrio sp.]|nr:response regulator [Vampirovibrio sp.]